MLGWRLPGGLALRRGDLNMLIVVYGGLQQGLGCILRTLSGKVRI